MYMSKEKMVTLIWKAFEITFRYLIFVKNESWFLCGHLIRKVKLVLMILTLPLNKNRSYEMPFKQTVRRV